MKYKNILYIPLIALSFTNCRQAPDSNNIKQESKYITKRIATPDVWNNKTIELVGYKTYPKNVSYDSLLEQLHQTYFWDSIFVDSAKLQHNQYIETNYFKDPLDQKFAKELKAIIRENRKRKK